VIVLLVLFMSATPLWSQGFHGTIRGDVRDPSGALVSGVTLHVKATTTCETRSTISSETGGFAFPNLLVAVYTLTAELPGFQSLHTREHSGNRQHGPE
jgi:hypothetical protein